MPKVVQAPRIRNDLFCTPWIVSLLRVCILRLRIRWFGKPFPLTSLGPARRDISTFTPTPGILFPEDFLHEFAFRLFFIQWRTHDSFSRFQIASGSALFNNREINSSGKPQIWKPQKAFVRSQKTVQKLFKRCIKRRYPRLHRSIREENVQGLSNRFTCKISYLTNFLTMLEPLIKIVISCIQKKPIKQ